MKTIEKSVLRLFLRQKSTRTQVISKLKGVIRIEVSGHLHRIPPKNRVSRLTYSKIGCHESANMLENDPF